MRLYVDEGLRTSSPFHIENVPGQVFQVELNGQGSLDLDLVYPSRAFISAYPYLALLGEFAPLWLPFCITLSLECLFALVLVTIKQRPHRWLLTVAIANCISYPIVVVILAEGYFEISAWVGAEAFAIVVEAFFLLWRLRPAISAFQALMFSTVANALSLFGGQYLFVPLLLEAYTILNI